MSRNIWVRTKNNASYYKIKIKAIQYYVQQYDSVWIFSISNSKPFVHVCIHSFGGFSIILTIVINHQAEMLTLTWKSTLHLKSILEDMVSIGTWIYLAALYFVPLIYISVFVPVPYCPDDCGFIVEPEVRQVDSSSSILLSQDCFGYSRFFVFPYKLWNYLF